MLEIVLPKNLEKKSYCGYLWGKTVSILNINLLENQNNYARSSSTPKPCINFSNGEETLSSFIDPLPQATASTTGGVPRLCRRLQLRSPDQKCQHSQGSCEVNPLHSSILPQVWNCQKVEGGKALNDRISWHAALFTGM